MKLKILSLEHQSPIIPSIVIVGCRDPNKSVWFWEILLRHKMFLTALGLPFLTVFHGLFWVFLDSLSKKSLLVANIFETLCLLIHFFPYSLIHSMFMGFNIDGICLNSLVLRRSGSDSGHHQILVKHKGQDKSWGWWTSEGKSHVVARPRDTHSKLKLMIIWVFLKFPPCGEMM